MKPEEKKDIIFTFSLAMIISIFVAYTLVKDTLGCRSALITATLFFLEYAVVYWRLRKRRKQFAAYYYVIFLMFGILSVVFLMREYCFGG